MSPFPVGKTPPHNLGPDREPSPVNAVLSDAEQPFDASAKADVILRSSNSIDFFVLKAILCLASPVFDHMFSFTPESYEGESTNKTKNGLPVVDLAEDSSTLYDLLPQLYPYPEELTDTLEVYIRVGKAAEKYLIDKVLRKLKKLIMNCSPMVNEPVATFAVAVHFGWVEVMRKAAHNSLAIPLRNLRDLRNLISGDGQSKYFHFISAADYRDFLSCRLACQDALTEIFASWRTTNMDIPLIRSIFSPHLSKQLKKTGCAQSTILMDDRLVPDTIMKSVFTGYHTLWGYNTARENMTKDIENALTKKINGIMVHCRSPSLAIDSGVSATTTPLDNSHRKPSTDNTGSSDAEKPFNAPAKSDLILRSSDSVDFFVLKAILCLTSPVFNHMFSLTPESYKGERTNKTKNGLPVVDLEEDSSTLYNLLLLIYPYAKEPTDTLEVYTRVAEAARKYVMDETLQKLKKLVMNCAAIVEEPVATFALGMHFGWVEVMREAALNSLAIPLRDLIFADGQSKYLRFIGAGDYCDLLIWHLACQDVLKELVANRTTEVTYVRRIFNPRLPKRLKETHCAQSMLLMDDCFMLDEALKSTSFSDYGLHVKMKDIDNALSKVPLEINGIVVQAGD